MTPAPLKVPEKIARIRELLQEALAVEHSTIPPYLTAWLSVQDGFNREAADIVRGVMLEEMLHLAQVANLMNAVGAVPTLTAPGFVPVYPHILPYSGAKFLIHIDKLSRDGSIDTFMQIEKPADRTAPPEPKDFHTIGQFYAAIERLLQQACDDLGEAAVFTGDAALQLGSEQYYGSGGLIRVISLETALDAMREIVDQGEGTDHGVFDDDRAVHGEGREPAHFFRFNEIKLGKRYAPGDTPSSGPSGPDLPFDESKIYNIRPDTKLADYPAGSEIRDALQHCASTYGSLLKALEDAFRGKPERMKDAIAAMFVFKYEAVALMRTPSGFGDGTSVGLTFEQGA